MKHTPGPWQSEPSDSLRGDPEAQIPEWAEFIIAGGPADEVIAFTCGPVVQGSPEANGRVLAAAPELLDALKAMLVAYEGTDDVLGPSMTGKVAAARAAVAKAEGRS